MTSERTKKEARAGSAGRGPILSDARDGEAFAGVSDPAAPEGLAVLTAIAAKIGSKRKPGATSDIPAGATYLAQLAAHDLDLRSREDVGSAPRLDLAVIYGDGPTHDAPLYQVPDRAGEPRKLLRLGRARPSPSSPPWGAARDLPRAACPHLDANGSEALTEVLVANSATDSNLLLGQTQTLWALLHNAVVALIDDGRSAADAFETARRITRAVYRDALIHDVLGTWLHPDLRGRYVRRAPKRLSPQTPAGVPRAFLAGVARIGHGLVRETYEINDQRPLEGLRSIRRHTSTGRPFDMPLTEDWLLDFGRFFDLGGQKTAQRARALGPHVARPFALGGGVSLDYPRPDDGLVLRDLLACARGGVPKVGVLVDRIEAADDGVLKGFFAKDERRWRKAVADWLEDLKLAPRVAKDLAEDPPLWLFLMLEAVADADGRSLGALGSILMAETIAAALPDPLSDADAALAREVVFRGTPPDRVADLVLFLQRHYRFADGARLHAAAHDAADPAAQTISPKEASMLDDRSAKSAPNGPQGLVQVADYIELGRMVADWATGDQKLPEDVDDLRKQLDGIAVVPKSIKKVKFVQGKEDLLVIRLPDADLVRQSKEELDSPLVEDRYMLPKFYDDIYQRQFGPQMTPLEIFLARVGDYTIAKCR